METRAFYTDSQIKRVRALAEAGENSTEIAKSLNRTQRSIRDLCKRVGIDLKRGRKDYRSREDVMKIYEMHVQGFTREEIAAKFDMTTTRVRETVFREHKRRQGESETNPEMSKLLGMKW